MENDNDNDNDDGRPDAHIDHEAALKYWGSISPDVSGMLGGYPQVSRIDLRGSHNFLTKLRRLSGQSSKEKLKLGADCGAGIGRITEGFLSHVCERIDVVEPVERFAKVVQEGELFRASRKGNIYVTGLEGWRPNATYDLIWNQWCVGHLTDAQLIAYLGRCSRALSKTGWIVVKENLSTHRFGKDLFDELDSSVTRSDESFRALFTEANLDVVRAELQTGFPKDLGLYPVKMYALRPK